MNSFNSVHYKKKFQKHFCKDWRYLLRDNSGKISDSSKEVFQFPSSAETKPKNSERFLMLSERKNSSQVSETLYYNTKLCQKIFTVYIVYVAAVNFLR